MFWLATSHICERNLKLRVHVNPCMYKQIHVLYLTKKKRGLISILIKKNSWKRKFPRVSKCFGFSFSFFKHFI